MPAVGGGGLSISDQCRFHFIAYVIQEKYWVGSQNSRRKGAVEYVNENFRQQFSTVIFHFSLMHNLSCTELKKMVKSFEKSLRKILKGEVIISKNVYFFYISCHISFHLIEVFPSIKCHTTIYLMLPLLTTSLMITSCILI